MLSTLNIGGGRGFIAADLAQEPSGDVTFLAGALCCAVLRCSALTGWPAGVCTLLSTCGRYKYLAGLTVWSIPVTCAPSCAACCCAAN